MPSAQQESNLAKLTATYNEAITLKRRSDTQRLEAEKARKQKVLDALQYSINQGDNISEAIRYSEADATDPGFPISSERLRMIGMESGKEVWGMVLLPVAPTGGGKEWVAYTGDGLVRFTSEEGVVTKSEVLPERIDDKLLLTLQDAHLVLSTDTPEAIKLMADVIIHDLEASITEGIANLVGQVAVAGLVEIPTELIEFKPTQTRE